MQFDLQPQEAAFVINTIGKLPTESGAFPIHQSLVAQFNAQNQPPQNQPSQDDVAQGGAGGTD